MADYNMHYGSYIPEDVTTAWVMAINNYELNYRPELIARNVLPYRDVGAQIDIDAITYHQSTSGLADFIAKGASPAPVTMRSKTEKHDMFQISTGFYVNERDLAKQEGATMKAKELDDCLAKIHAREDYTLMNGNTGLGITGIVGHAHANERGKVVASGASGNDVNNMGAWDGTDDTRDPYEDVVNAIKLMDWRFKPYALLADRPTISYLNMKDSERIPFWVDMCALFGKADDDRSWMIESQFCPTGYAYIIPYNPQAAEFVVSQEIDIIDDYPKEKGGNYWIEVREWLNPVEIHVPEAFVEISTL
jgi:hypothetical protein